MKEESRATIKHVGKTWDDVRGRWPASFELARTSQEYTPEAIREVLTPLAACASVSITLHSGRDSVVVCLRTVKGVTRNVCIASTGRPRDIGR